MTSYGRSWEKDLHSMGFQRGILNSLQLINSLWTRWNMIWSKIILFISFFAILLIFFVDTIISIEFKNWCYIFTVVPFLGFCRAEPKVAKGFLFFFITYVSMKYCAAVVKYWGKISSGILIRFFHSCLNERFSEVELRVGPGKWATILHLSSLNGTPEHSETETKCITQISWKLSYL